METLLNFDSSVLLWIQSIRAPALTAFFRVITYFGEFGIFWGALCVALICIKKHRRAGVVGIAALAIGFVICNLLLKNLVARVRPYVAIEGLRAAIEKPTDWSFPSGHTTASFAVSFAVFLTERKRWNLVLIVLAALIGISRVYLGVHYPTDVLVGALIGVISAAVSERIISRRI